MHKQVKDGYYAGGIQSFCGVAVCVLSLIILMGESSAIRYVGIGSLVAGAMVLARGWLILSIVSEESTGAKPQWGFERVILGMLNPIAKPSTPSPDAGDRQTLWQAIVQVANVREMVPYTLLSGGLALMNLAIFKSAPIEGFCVGAFLGAVLFVSFWGIPRMRGAAMLLATCAWVYLFYSQGMVELLARQL